LLILAQLIIANTTLVEGQKPFLQNNIPEN